ncbi:hypothetical protein GCM10027056_02040 [Glaciibacter psychrotolerans]
MDCAPGLKRTNFEFRLECSSCAGKSYQINETSRLLLLPLRSVYGSGLEARTRVTGKPGSFPIHAAQQN